MPTSARPGFFPHSRQGTRALPYKALRYRARADRGVRPVHSFFRLGATHIKKALCYDAGIIAKGFFILDCAYLTSSMMAVSAASPRRMPVRMMRV